jgi:hypothetical protein
VRREESKDGGAKGRMRKKFRLQRILNVLTSEVENRVVKLVAYKVNTSEAVILNLVEP